jgi:hypothetical protein
MNVRGANLAKALYDALKNDFILFESGKMI